MNRKAIRIIMLLLVAMSLGIGEAKAEDNVKYMDWDDTEKKLVEKTTLDNVDVTVLTGDETVLGTDGAETWYVTSGTTNFTSTITLKGHVHIILANGTTMNVGTSTEPIPDCGIVSNSGGSSSLTIHAQKCGEGTLNIYTRNGGSKSDGIEAGTFTICGGKVNIEAGDYGIVSDGDLNLYGAEIMAKSTNFEAICANNSVVNIIDSKVSATAGGDCAIYAKTDITIQNSELVATGTGNRSNGIEAEGSLNIIGSQVKAEGGSTLDGMLDGINCPINLTWTRSSDYLLSKGYGGDLTIAYGKNFYMTEVDIPDGKQNPISGTISEGSIDEDIPFGAKLVPALPVQGGSPYTGSFGADGGWALPNGVKAFTPQGYDLAAGTASLAEISGVPDSRTVILGSSDTGGGDLPSTFYLIGTTVANAASYERDYQNHPFQSNFKTNETGSMSLGDMIGNANENIALILSDGSFKSFNYTDLNQKPAPQHVFLIVSKWDMLTKGSGSSGSSGARSIGIDTGGATGIKLTPILSEDDGVWYSLGGRKLSVKPTAKGVYINKGKKYVVR